MNFQNFLTLKLKERKIDVSVYHSYLLSILEDQGLDEEEKRETVQDIVASLVVSCNKIYIEASSHCLQPKFTGNGR